MPVYTPVYTLGTPLYPLHAPSSRTDGAKRTLPPWKQPSVRDGGPYPVYNRLIRVPARCIIPVTSYTQCSNQLRKRRLCSFLTVYSASEWPRRCFSGVTAVSAALHRCYMFYAFTCFTCFTLFMLFLLYAWALF